MTAYRIALFGVLCGMSVMVSHAALCPTDSQTADEPANPKPKVIGQAGPGASLQSIHEDYARQLLLLERQRLDRLGQLAARQAPTEAAETYEQLFRLAIANNLFTDAEAAAKEALKSPNAAPPVVQFLAHTIDIIASADRGDYDGSTAELRSLIEATSRRKSSDTPGPALDTSALLGDLPGVPRSSDPGKPVRCRAQRLQPGAQGIRKPRRQGVLHPPPRPARLDRQSGTGHRRNGLGRQEGQPCRAQG